jgi:Cytochrome oxidase assembly factor
VLKKNRFLFFVILNTVLLIVILFLSIPISKLLKKINLDDNEFIEGQVIINPKAVSPAILDREVNIKLLAKVDESLNWSFEPLQDNIVVKIGENTKVEYNRQKLNK